jgi:CBS domain-containing protein
MASNTIVTRVYDFLAKYPPFSYLSKAELMPIAVKVQVQYYPNNDALFKQDDPARPFVFVLHKGKIEISKNYEEGAKLIDICDEGDVFGVRSALNGQPYIGNAIVGEDSLIYAIPKDVFLKLMEENAKISLFFASGLASGMPIIREGQTRPRRTTADLHLFGKEDAPKFMSQEDILIVNPVEDVVTCTPSHSIRSAAQYMQKRRVGSIIVIDEDRKPIGIVTDTDFARKVVADNISKSLPISEIMSSPVYTIEPNATISQYIIRMIKYKVKHLVVTEDGTTETPLIGVASEHDILLMHGNDPAVLVKRLLKARSVAELAKVRNRSEELIVNYLKQEVSIDFITDIMTEINDAMINRALQFALRDLKKEGFGEPPVKFCWLSMGSEGRGEQLLRTDQDNAIVYEDPTEEVAPIAEKYFLELGKKVVDIMVACGFSLCKGEIMASNPKWNQPVSVWKSYFKQWIYVPEPMALMHSSIFFDLRGTFGEMDLAKELNNFILNNIKDDHSLFLNLLAKNALKNPAPLSFFKNFVVEKSGENKDLFDIKLRSMMPLTDIARLLVLAEGIPNIKNTFRRFDRLKTVIPNREGLFDEAAMAYELFIRTRALNGFRYNNSGRFIQPEDLNKIERHTLRYAFETVENVQLYVKHRFGLSIQ